MMGGLTILQQQIKPIKILSNISLIFIVLFYTSFWIIILIQEKIRWIADPDNETMNSYRYYPFVLIISFTVIVIIHLSFVMIIKKHLYHHTVNTSKALAMVSIWSSATMIFIIPLMQNIQAKVVVKLLGEMSDQKTLEYSFNGIYTCMVEVSTLITYFLCVCNIGLLLIILSAVLLWFKYRLSLINEQEQNQPKEFGV